MRTTRIFLGVGQRLWITAQGYGARHFDTLSKIAGHIVHDRLSEFKFGRPAGSADARGLRIPPVVQRQSRNPREMIGVAGIKSQLVFNGCCGNHKIRILR